MAGLYGVDAIGGTILSHRAALKNANCRELSLLRCPRRATPCAKLVFILRRSVFRFVPSSEEKKKREGELFVRDC